MNILNVQDHVTVDNSIINLQYHTHQPYANNRFNNNDEIRIPIQDQNIYTLPSQSFLYIEGKLLDHNDKPSPTLQFVNNGFAFLFDNIRYELGAAVLIDSVRNPGITGLMKGYVSYTENESLRLHNAGWALDNPKVVDGKTGNFNVCIPLRMLLGFGEDFQKILINIKQELVLLRSSNDLNAIYTTKADEKPKITINRILWKVPHVSVNDKHKLRLLDYVEMGKELDIPFRCWELQEYVITEKTTRLIWSVQTTSNIEKPRYAIIGFQTNRKNLANKLMNCFDHCHLTDIKLYLNSAVYPYDSLNLNFDMTQWAILYEMYAQFQQSYYYKQQSHPCLSPKQFLEVAPLIVIDCSRQQDEQESIKGGIVDIRLEINTQQEIPANTIAYCLILHDRLVTYRPKDNQVKIKV